MSTDAGRGVFRNQLSGTAVQKVIKIIDNGGAGYTKSGSWTIKKNIGRDRDIELASPTSNPAPTATASWTFNNLEAGSYRVHVSNT